ncbi:MAG TPA: orotidine-5'-phosphate decarboxylase [Thermoanaerobaculia bacterium]|nr:orotidine-5'-phosphate decarboxylase [Thermoanaerobaculia bacterium]
MQSRDRLIVALDRSSREEILRLVDALRGTAGAFKIGLQAFIANGPALVREIVSSGEKVFLDLKIHDIPNTARRAVAEAASLGVAMTTVHAAGGEAMVRASARADLLILGITVLTSLDAAELPRIGLGGSVVENAVRLARLSKDCGLRGVVASPEEIAAIRDALGRELVIVTPGVRPEGSSSDDQRRTETPAAAIAAGADYVVVGRPIIDAREPRQAALRIMDSIPTVAW